MFERFSASARAAVIRARDESDRLDHGGVGTAHLLLALLADEDVATALLRHGVTPAAVEQELRRLTSSAGAGVDTGTSQADRDRDALRSIGIDVDRLREAVEAAFGPGALDRPVDRQPSGPIRRLLGRGQGGGRRANELAWLTGRSRHRPGRSRRHHAPFSRNAKTSLELSLREAIRLKDRSIGTDHLVLGLLREDRGTAAAIFGRLGVDRARLRSDLEQCRGRRT